MKTFCVRPSVVVVLTLSLHTWAAGPSEYATSSRRRALVAQRYTGKDSSGNAVTFEPSQGRRPVREFTAFATVGGQVFGFLGANFEPDDSITISAFVRGPRGWTELGPVGSYADNPAALRVTPFSLGPLLGVLVGNPTPSRGNPRLKLLAVEANRLRFVEGSEDLGELTVFDAANNLATAYVRCGCADACWWSTLLEASGNQLVVRGRMGCDCERFVVELDGGSTEPTACPTFTNKESEIDARWRTLLSNSKR